MRVRALAFLIVLLALPASAATCGGILNPVAFSLTALAFGNYQPGAPTATKSNATLTVSCTVTLGSSLPAFDIALSPSVNGHIDPRQMSFLASTLNYDLYTTSGLSTIWGDGTAPTGKLSYSGGTGSTNFTIFGAIPNDQFASPGLYTDLITVTVTY
jgi:spore coat protein U-like protein